MRHNGRFPFLTALILPLAFAMAPPPSNAEEIPPAAAIPEWQFAGPQVLAGYQVSGLAYGAGRWVASSWGWFTTSEDGRRWTYPRGFRPHAHDGWSRIDFLGDKFLWWGAYGTTARMASSSDGLTWTPARDESSGDPFVGFIGFNQRNRVQDAAFGNGIYVAVGLHRASEAHRWDGTIWRSTNGHEWSRVYQLPRAEGIDHRELLGVGFGDGRFIAVGEHGTVAQSTDGLTWTETRDPLGVWDPIEDPEGITNPLTDRSITGICHGSLGWIATVQSRLGSKEVIRSQDGLTWSLSDVHVTPTSPSVFSVFNAVLYKSFYAHGKYWFTTSTAILATDDGINFSLNSERGPIAAGPEGASPRLLAGGGGGALYESNSGTAWDAVVPMAPVDHVWSAYQTLLPLEGEWLASAIPASASGWQPPHDDPGGSGSWAPGIPNGVLLYGQYHQNEWREPPSARSQFSMAEYANTRHGLILAGVREDEFRVGEWTAGIANGPSPNPASPLITSVPLAVLERNAAIGTFKDAVNSGIPRPWGYAHAPICEAPSSMELYVELGRNSSYVEQRKVIWGHFTSQDGNSWTRRPLGLNNATNFPGIRGLAWGAGKYVAVGGRTPGVSPNAHRIWTSDDGENYTPIDAPAVQGENLTGLVFANNHFVAIGGSGGIYRSADGLAWESVRESDGRAWNRIRHFESGILAVVGNAGELAFSGNGVNWIEMPPGVEADLNDIGERDGRYMIVGHNGMVLASTARSPAPILMPVAGEDSLSMDAKATIQIESEKLLANDSDSSGAPLSIIGVTKFARTLGRVSQNGSTISYTPPPNFFGQDEFHYLVQNTAGSIATGRVRMNIRPTTGAGLVRIAANSGLEIELMGVPGIDYTVQESFDLNSWTTVAVLTAADSGLFTFTQNSISGTARFYRAVAP